MTCTRRGLALALMAAAALACAKEAAPPAADTQADVAAIAAVRDREAALLATGSMDSLLNAVYTEDVLFLPPDEPAVQGREAVRTWGNAMFAQVGLNARYAASQPAVISGDLAVETYTATLTITPKAAGASTAEEIKGIHVLRRQADGSWRIAVDTWNTNAPPPPAPAPATKK